MKNLIFDIDGTLIDSSLERSFYEALKQCKYNSREYRQAKKVLFEKQNLSTLYNGFSSVFDFIRANSIKTAIATNSVRKRVEGFVDRFNIPITNNALIHKYYFNRFGSIKKPNPMPLQTAMQLIGGDNSNTLMVGNEPDDINAAKRCGCKSVACKWGATTENWEEMLTLKPDYVIETPIELINIIAA